MGDTDPHIHVQSNVLHADAAVRDVMASTFGLVGDLPSVVTTGCGLSVAYAMTSPRPENVTCLACREHAHTQHLRFADWVERMGRMPGATITSAQAGLAADQHRDLAARFSSS
jgi:hypothetical protein